MLDLVLQQRRRLYREGLVALLADHPSLQVVGAAAAEDDLLDLCVELQPDVVLIELDAEAWDPCRLAQRVQKVSPQTRFVGMYATDDASRICARARRAQIRHVVSRDLGIDEVTEALLAAGEDRTVPIVVPPSDGNVRGMLTPREVGVLELISAGLTSKEISDGLRITHKTVENHKQRIFAKLGVQNQAHAVAVAIRHGYIRPAAVIDITEGAQTPMTAESGGVR
jgi:DNA-binding NarL/FixJ family response regulator